MVRRMRDGLIEETRYLRNPLDVLAQQIVATTAMEEWSVPELAALVRRAAGFADITDDVFAAVLDLLAGRYPSEEFSELRPRIVWDRVGDRIRARDGAKRLAVTSGGTIPDRGLFGVFLPDGTRVGELDEEMVYESRPGETFLLGASTWRIEDITFERVVVTPAPGQPGKMPFWHGDRPGRPLELGRALGAFVREVRQQEPAPAVQRLHDDDGLDAARRRQRGAVPRSTRPRRRASCPTIARSSSSASATRSATGGCASCRRSARPVHAPWAMAIERRLSDRYGMAVETMWSDDGIVIRLPEAADEIPADDLLIDPDEIDELVVSTLPSTPLFSSRFRECAARALLLPRRRPDSRTPLWQQRQRAADLLAVAAKYPTFPILLEASRECLQDVFDVPALRTVLADLRSRKIRLVSVDTQKASPFAQSLLFNWIAAYMYEGDAPLAERRAAALALDRDLLRELLGAEELRELIDAEVLADLELELQCLVEHRRARSVDELHDLLRRLGDLSAAELDVRADGPAGAAAEWIAQLVRRAARLRRCASPARSASPPPRTPPATATPSAPPCRSGCPRAFTEPVEHPLESLVARYARTHGPFLATAAARRLGISVERAVGALQALETEGRVVRGEFRPDGVEREWCDNDVLRQLRRRSHRRAAPGGRARRAGRAGALPAGVAGRGGGRDAASTRLVEAIGRAAGRGDRRRRMLDGDVLARACRRVPAGRPRRAVHLRRARVGRRRARSVPSDGRVRLYFRDQVALLAPRSPPTTDRPEGAVHDALRAHLAQRGACFWADLARRRARRHRRRAARRAVGSGVGRRGHERLAGAGAGATWRGAVAKRSGGGRRAVARPRPGRLTRLGPPSGAGRWSLVAAAARTRARRPPRPRTPRASQLLERHGVLAREAVLAEGVEGGFAGVYGVLKVLEERGQVRRGYFVAGLGAAQFALPGAVDRLRAARDTRRGRPYPLVLAATDPAQPYGAALRVARAGRRRATGPGGRGARRARPGRARGVARPARATTWSRSRRRPSRRRLGGGHRAPGQGRAGAQPRGAPDRRRAGGRVAGGGDVASGGIRRRLPRPRAPELTVCHHRVARPS